MAGDLNQPESVRGALQDVQSVFLLGGYRDMNGLLAEIRRAGVQRVVLLSSRSIVGGNQENAIVRMWVESEDAVRSSATQWTILRPSSFMSNALQWVSQIRKGDVVRAPFAGVPVAAIDPSDIAAVAAVALTSDGHAARAYELSGPMPVVPREQVRILADVLQRRLRFEPQPDTEAREQMLKSSPPTFVDAFFRFYGAGEFNDAVVVPTVEEITGRKMRSFEQWATANAGKFAG